MRRLAALLKLTLVLCSLLLLWLGFGYVFSGSVSRREVRRDGPEEERRCLYRQGLSPAAYGHLAENDTYSQFFCGTGTYPAGLCTVHLAYLSHGERRFVARTKELYESRMNNELSSRLWPMAATSHGWPRCTQYFDEAFVFGVDTSVSDELYFQLHVKTLMPLYSLLALRKHLGPPPAPGYSVVLLPAVEDYSLKVRPLCQTCKPAVGTKLAGLWSEDACSHNSTMHYHGRLLLSRALQTANEMRILTVFIDYDLSGLDHNCCKNVSESVSVILDRSIPYEFLRVLY